MQSQHQPVRVFPQLWRGVFYGALLSLLGWTLVLAILYWLFTATSSAEMANAVFCLSSLSLLGSLLMGNPGYLILSGLSTFCQ